MMTVLQFVFAVVVLALGASFLWLLSEEATGNEEKILHFGNVLLVTVVGAVTFSFWGWVSVPIVLILFGGMWIISGLFQRFR